MWHVLWPFSYQGAPQVLFLTSICYCNIYFIRFIEDLIFSSGNLIIVIIFFLMSEFVLRTLGVLFTWKQVKRKKKKERQIAYVCLEVSVSLFSSESMVLTFSLTNAWPLHLDLHVMRWGGFKIFFYLSPGRGCQQQGHERPRENQHGCNRPVWTKERSEREDEEKEEAKPLTTVRKSTK